MSKVALSSEPPEPRLTYSVDEAARALGIGRSLTWRLIRSGRLPTVKIGRRTLIRRSEVERLLDEGVDDTVFLA